MKNKSKFYIGGIVIIIAVFSLLLTSIPSFASTEVDLTDILNNPENYVDKFILTEGFLIENSIDWNSSTIELNFKIKDENDRTLAVHYNGVSPDNFSDGIIVILNGNIKQNGIFETEQLLTKCPSKYESENQSVYNADKYKINLPINK